MIALAIFGRSKEFLRYYANAISTNPFLNKHKQMGFKAKNTCRKYIICITQHRRKRDFVGMIFKRKIYDELVRWKRRKRD